MKDFIVIVAILPILMLFIMQGAKDAIRNEKIYIIQDRLYIAKEEAKQRGGFDDDLVEQVISDISTRLEIPREDIELKVTQGKKERYDEDNKIEYSLAVKIKDVMAGNQFMGISDDNNSYVYVIDSYTTSEYVNL